MDNRVELDSMIHMAVAELDSREYEEYIKNKRRNKLFYPDEKLNKRINKVINKEERKEKQIIFAKRVSKIAVSFAIIFSCLSGTFLTAEAVRESVVTVAIEWYEKFTRTTIISEDVPTELPEIELGYIPEGYSTYGSILNSKTEYFHQLSLDKENIINIQIRITDEKINFDMDNERINYYTILIDNDRALWLSDGKYNGILIHKNNISFWIHGFSPLNEIINIYKKIFV